MKGRDSPNCGCTRRGYGYQEDHIFEMRGSNETLSQESDLDMFCWQMWDVRLSNQEAELNRSDSYESGAAIKYDKSRGPTSYIRLSYPRGISNREGSFTCQKVP